MKHIKALQLLPIVFVCIFQLAFGQAPTINSFAPAVGSVGATVSFQTSEFNGSVVGVSFNGTPATQISGFDLTSFSAVVPPGATTGPLSVQFNGAFNGTVITASTFTVCENLPALTLSTNRAPVGSNIVISGSGFSTISSENIVYFGHTRASVVSSSAGQITATVPVGAHYCRVTVLNSNTGITRSTATLFSQTFDYYPGISQFNFGTPTSNPITGFGSAEPCNIAVADIDGDGKPDLVTSNRSGGIDNRGISIFKNVSNPGALDLHSFLNIANFSSENFYAVALGDLNADGKPDLVACKSGAIWIYKNISSIGSISASSFDTPIQIATGVSSFDFNNLQIADLNWDGKPEIVLLTTDDISTQTFRKLFLIQNYSSSSAMSNATFGTPVLVHTQVGDLSGSLEIADMDNDGLQDIVISGGSITILKNLSHCGTIYPPVFANAIQLGGVFAGKVAVADLNNDGRPDIIASPGGDTLVSIFQNVSSTGVLDQSSFGNRQNILIPGLDHVAYNGLVATDWNGDGHIDLLLDNHPLNDEFFVLQNQGIPSDISSSSFALTLRTSASFRTIYKATDMDQDGAPDLLGVAGTIMVFAIRNQGGLLPVISSFNPTSRTGGSSFFIHGNNFQMVTAVKIGETNCQIANLSPNGSSLEVNIPLGASSGLIELVYSGGSVFSITPMSIYCNNPGAFEFSPKSGPVGSVVHLNVFPEPEFDNNVIYFGDTKATSYTGTDDRIDVIVPPGADHGPITFYSLSAEESWVHHSIGNFSTTFPGGTGITASNFEAPVQFYNPVCATPPQSFCYSIDKVASGDFDADGKTDLVVAGGIPLSIFQNTSTPGAITDGGGNPSNGSFSARFELGPANVSDVLTTDFNQDGKTDIVTIFVDAGSCILNFYTNVHTGGALSTASFAAPFSKSVAIPSGYAGFSGAIAAADFSQEGFIDIAYMLTSEFTANTSSKIQEVGIFQNVYLNRVLAIPPVVISSSTSSGNFLARLQAGDLDHDGKMDLALAGGTGISLFRNQHSCGNPFQGNPSGGFPASFESEVQMGLTMFTSIELADLNNDNYLDILLGGNPSSGGSSGPFFQSNFAVIENLIPTIGGFNSASFSNPIPFDNGPHNNPISPFLSPTVGDFDGDGFLDVFVTSGFDDLENCLIFRNTAQGGAISAQTFDAPVFIPLANGGGGGMSGTAAQDMDMDGKTDLVVAYVNGVFKVRRNFPRNDIPPIVLSFTPNRANPGQPITIKGAGFLPQSGNRPSKANGPSVQNTTPPTIQDLPKNHVFFGIAEGFVITAVDTEMVVRVPYGATFDRITVLNENTNLTGTSSQAFTPTYLSTSFFGAGNFAAPSTSMRHNSPKGVAMGDLDGDGRADMVVANNGSASISIYNNLTTPGILDSAAFQPSFNIPVQNDPVDVAIADLNGDGKPEILICHKASSQVTVMRNESTTGALSETSFPNQQLFFVGDGPVCVKVADLTNDGRPDIVTANFTQGNFSVLENQHISGPFVSSSFATYVDYDGDLSECTSIAIGQLDNQFGLDIAVANQNTNTIQVFRNLVHENGLIHERFKPGQILATGTQPQSVKIADFDGDGKQDLVVSCSEISNPAIILFQNQSVPGSLLEDSFSEPIHVGNAGFLEELEVADMNGDGRLDLITVESETDRVYVYPNISNPGTSLQDLNFDNRFSKKVKRLPTALAVGDLDNDGRPDIVTSNNLHNSLSIIHNDPRVSVTVSAGAHGSITPSGVLSLSPFSDPEFVIVPENGFQVDKLLVDGLEVSDPETNPFVLENLDGDRTLAVSFKVICPELSFSAAPINQQVSVTTTCQSQVFYLVVANNVNEYTYRLTGATIDTGSGVATGHIFNGGVTHVKIYAYNSCNEVITHEFDVILLDMQAPVLTCSGNTQVTATDGSVTVTIPPPTYSDNCAVVSLSYTINTPGSFPGGTTTFVSSPVGINIIPPITLGVGTTTVQYLSKDAAGNQTPCLFTIEVVDGTPQPPAKPVISLATGTYNGPQTVSITSSTPEASIYYTVSGNTPVVGTGFTKLYTQPFPVLESTTIRAMCVKNGFANSAVAVSFLTITYPGICATPVISPNGGTASGSTTVTFSCATAGVRIYYTYSGNTPVIGTSFTHLYTNPFQLLQSATVKAMAVKEGLVNSPLSVAIFTINDPIQVAAMPQISPGTGVYIGPQTITITSTTPGATIYYTTTGNTPRFDVPNGFTKLYTGSFVLSSNATIKAVTTAPGYLNSGTAVSVISLGIGRMAISGTVPTEDAKDKLRVFPNPSANGRFTLALEGVSPNEGAEIVVFDINGKKLQQKKLDINATYFELNLEGKPPGMYLLQYQSGNEMIQQKIMIR